MTTPNAKRIHQRSSLRDAEVTAERVRDLFNLDIECGVLTYRTNPRFSSGYVGRVAGAIRKDGYWGVNIDGKSYLVHRVIWLHRYGEWPESQIDHKNGVRSDNSAINLRECVQAQNAQNLRKAKGGSRSGLLGVFRNGRGWGARIGVRGKKLALGTYATPEEAHRVYVSAKRQLHEFCSI